MNENGKIPYSYHTFLYPFLFYGQKEGAGLTDAFCDQLEGSGWTPADPVLWDGQNPSCQDRESYQILQYFNESAQKAILGADANICRNFRLTDIRQKPAKYCMESKKTTRKTDTHPEDAPDIRIERETFRLNLSDIRLMVFNTGVAVLAFETEYADDAWYRETRFERTVEENGIRSIRTESEYTLQGSLEKARDGIRKINEYGRRLYPEYLPAGECAICGTKLWIEVDGKKTSACTDFEGREEKTYLSRPVWLPEIIRQTLTGLPQTAGNWIDAFEIKPAVDDRMFVCCCVNDSEYASSFKEYRTDAGLAKQLYAVCSIDAGDSSCQHFASCRKYLDEQLYLRWADYGTIFCVTNHSMLCLTGNPTYTLAGVINPFLMLYTRMCCLSIAQRATLLRLNAEITDAVSRASGAEGEAWKDVSELEKKFARFQGELMLAEVTPQIQGIEIYDRLQKMLFIGKLEEDIQKQLHNLYEIAEAEQARRAAEEEKRNEAKEAEQACRTAKRDGRLNTFLIWFTILTLFSAAADFTSILTGPSGSPTWNWSEGILGILIGLTALMGLVFIVLPSAKERKAEKKRKNRTDTEENGGKHE